MAADTSSADTVFRPELLAPAGSLETALAAFAAGADAVYLGLGKFNARSRAENFTPDRLARLLDYAHAMRRKVHVTFNTLVTEPELPDVMSHLALLAELGPDAVIVQDFGVLHLLRRYFPEIAVHASTQMGIHNSLGVRALARIGVKRVILERQLTLEEVRKIAAQAPVELELFLHGSMCVSLSGRCFLSAYAEHASGNRGVCRQLCRRLYRRNGGEGFPLSPPDMQGLALLAEWSRLRIASLKIEGRLRGPDYVYNVTEAYRKAIDALPERSPEAGEMLRRTVSRRNAPGTYGGFGDLIHPEESGVFGRRAGTVRRVTPRELRIDVEDRFHLGDRMRIADKNGESVAGFLLTRLADDRGGALTAARKGDAVRIAGAFPGVAPGMTLYKLGENGRDFRRRAEALPEARRVLALDVVLQDGELCVTSPALPDFAWRADGFEPARLRAWSEEALAAEFAKLPAALWRPASVTARIAGAWFCPAGRLKELRRACHEAVGARLAAQKDSPGGGARQMLAFQRDYNREKTPPPPLELPPDAAVMTVPGLIAEGELPRWRDKVLRAWREGVRVFRLGGIHALELVRELPEEGRILLAAPPWAVTDSMAAELLRGLGIAGAEAHPELPETALAALREHSVLPVLPCREPTPLLVSRMEIPWTGGIADRQGRRFRLERDRGSGLTFLWAADDPAAEKLRDNPDY